MIFTKVMQFLDWWKAQLLSMVPRLFTSIFTKKTVIITYDGSQYSISKPTHNIDMRRKPGSMFEFEKPITNSNLAPTLKFFKKQLAKSKVVLLLTNENFFCRQSKVPSKAIAHGDQILQQDLRRLSPNEQSNLVADWYIRKNDGEKTMVQLMVKKEIITLVVKQLNKNGLPLVNCSALLNDGKIAPVNFLKNWYSPPISKYTIIKKLTAYLVLSSVLLAILLAWQNHNNQMTLIAQLELDVRKSNARAKTVLEKIKTATQNRDISSQLLTMKSTSQFAVGTWEEMSKTFPDSVWLLQFDILGEKVKISGFAKSAAELIERIEASSQFSNARFLSPVVAGIGNGLERFTITFHLSNTLPYLAGDK